MNIMEARVREHWGYRDGHAAHRVGRNRDDCLFPLHTFAACCWRAGWDAAERESIAASHREKAEAERAVTGLA